MVAAAKMFARTTYPHLSGDRWYVEILIYIEYSHFEWTAIRRRSPKRVKGTVENDQCVDSVLFELRTH